MTRSAITTLYAVILSAPLYAGDGSVGTNFCVCHSGAADPCAIPNSSAGCTNSTGQGGLLKGGGSASVLADDLVLAVTNVPPGAFGIIFLGGAEIQLPFGDGIRCVAPGPPNLNRFLVKQADAAGAFSEGPGIVGFSQTWFPMNAQIVGGMTFKFQGWYRDAQGPCQTSFNYTNGLSITFNMGGDLTEFEGEVFYDFNENGVFDELDPFEILLPDWRIDLGRFNDVPGVTFTDDNGQYSLEVDRDDSLYYIASNAPPPGFVGEPGARWFATTPNPVFELASVPAVTQDFGVVFYTNDDTDDLVRDAAFWRTSEGEALLEDCDPEWRFVINDLCLRTNVSAGPEEHEETFFFVTEPDDEPPPRIDKKFPTSFEVAYEELTDFLNTPDETHLANRLSKEVAAAFLNITCGPLQGQSICIDREDDGVLVEFEDLAADTIDLLCDPCAADTALDMGKGEMGEGCIDEIEACLNEWEGINSNGNGVYVKSANPTAIMYDSPYMSTFGVGSPK